MKEMVFSGLEKNNRIIYLDFLKTIAMAMVISLHVVLWDTSYAFQYGARILCEGVPIFAFVTGYLVFGRKSYTMGKSLKKALSILVLAVIWSIILYFVGIIIDGSYFNVSNLIREVMAVRGGVYSGVLWYLYGLAGLYLIFPILNYLYMQDEKKWHVVFAMVAFFAVTVGSYCSKGGYTG